MPAAGFGERGHEVAVEFFAAGFERFVFGGGFFEQGGGIIAVAAPVRAQVLFEILDGEFVVIGEHEPAGDGVGGDLAEVEIESEPLRTAVIVRSEGIRSARRADGPISGPEFRRGASVLPKPCRLGSLKTVQRGCSWVVSCHVQFAPIDAKVIAPFSQHRLFDRANAQHLKPRNFALECMHLLCPHVDGDFRRSVEIHLRFVFLAVRRLRLPAHVGHRPRVNHQIIRQRGGHESQRQPHALAFEGINRSRGQNFDLCLRHRGDYRWLFAEEAESFILNADQTCKPMRLARPVHSICVVRFICW